MTAVPRTAVGGRVVRPGAAGGHASTSSASCATSTEDRRGRVTVTITPTYSGLPGDGRDPGRHPSRAGRAPATPTPRSAPCCARPGPPTGSPRPGGRKLAAAGIAPPAPARRGSSGCALTVRVPALRVAGHRGDLPVRLDRVQGAVALPGLPRAVRPREGAMTATRPVRTPRRRPVFHPLPVAAVDRLTDDAVAVTFAVPPELRDDVRVPRRPAPDRAAAPTDGDEVRRSYSICSTPAELAATGVLRIGVRRDPRRRLLHATPRRRCAPATRSRCCRRWATSPRRSRPTARRHYAAVVAGSGITPVLSLVATALAIEPASRFTLVYGNRRAAHA